MGIKNLNKYIRMNCSTSIRKINFSELQWKKIAVDISIYLYKFKSENMLMEQLYLMINLFRYYNIIPIFVFDGKPPDEKKELLTQRKEGKKKAMINYEILKEQYETADNEEEKRTLSELMELEKKKTIRINYSDLENAKNLIKAMGVNYIEAEGEADQLCAYFVKTNKVYGCLSEDMDMFVYGCKRVFRYLNLFNRTLIYYDLDNILNELEINFCDFKNICVLSGTDYNLDNTNEFTLFSLMKDYKNFESCENDSDSFIDWVKKNYSIMDVTDLLNLFDVNNLSCKNDYDNLIIENTNLNMNSVKNIMEKEKFIFV